MVFDFVDFDVARSTQTLAFDVVEQFAVGKCLLVVFDHHEVLGLHDDDTVDIAFGGNVFPESSQGSDFDIVQFPMVSVIG